MRQQQSFRKSENSKRTIFGDGIFAIGILTGILISIVLFLGAQLWSRLLSQEQIIDLLPSVTAFLVALVSLQISFKALSEQKRMRQAGVDPVLVAHLGKDPMFPLVLSLNISNVGAGAAMNVKAQLNGKIPAGRSDFLDRMVASDFFNHKRPLAVILQNQSIPHWIGTGPDLFGKDDPIPVFSVTLTYEDIEGSSYHSVHQINILEYENSNANEPADTKMWRELEKIRKIIEKLK